jgi:hypothetical protein
MEQLLKLEHSAATEPRAGWERTIRTERADLVEDPPSLRARIERGLARFYEAAHLEAAVACAPTARMRPPTPSPRPAPYTLDQITGDWLPDQGRGAREASTS